MIRLEIPILFLEYYASGQAVCILKRNYSVAQRFSYKANWYEGTIAGKNRSSVHGLFITVYSVGLFADGHGQFSVTKSVGNGLAVLIPMNGSTEGFTEYTEWNHGSPSAVYVWSSVAGDNVVIYNIVGRTNSHNNGGFSVRILSANSVIQSVGKNYVIAVAYTDNDFKISFLIRVDGQLTFTISNINASWGNINICIFYRFIEQINIESAINIYFVSISVNNRYANSIIFAGWTIGRIKFERVIKDVCFINDGHFTISILTICSSEAPNSNSATNKTVITIVHIVLDRESNSTIVYIIAYELKSCTSVAHICCNFTSQAVFVNLKNFCSVYGTVVNYFRYNIIVFIRKFDNSIYSLAKSCNSEGYVGSSVVIKRNANSIFTESKVTCIYNLQRKVIRICTSSYNLKYCIFAVFRRAYDTNIIIVLTL